MKTNTKRLATAGLIALLAAGAGTTMAFGMHKGQQGCDRGGRTAPVAALKQLDNVSSDQQTALNAIRKDSRAAMQGMRDAMRSTRSELRQAMQDGADLDTIRDLAERQGDQKTAMIMLRAETRQKVSAVLTDAQRQQLAELRSERQRFGHPRNGRGDF